MVWRTATAIIALSVAAASASAAFAQTTAPPVSPEARLAEGRRMLAETRGDVAERLKAEGSLSADDLATVHKMTQDAMRLWAGCVTARIDRTAATVEAQAAVDQAFAGCKADRDEVAAWLKLASAANKAETSDALITRYLDEKELDGRGQAAARLAKIRGAAAPAM